ncbi:MAG: Fic family protein [Clostridiales Family XIII bacterium]|jgi:Fic family protein|nr:Fic family protein [Clostridiales Family XIII bacterium]
MTDGRLGVLEQLLAEREMRYKGGLYHSTQIEFAYNSNHMEGSALTKEETRHIYETNSLIPESKEAVNVDDIVETVNHFRCFDYLLDVARAELTEETVKEFHRMLKTGTGDARKSYFAVGAYKQIENTVGNIETTLPEKVPAAMKRLLESYNRIIAECPDADEAGRLETILDFHVRFERIHPFQDGNGRVGRLIMFKECVRNGVMPFVIEDRNRIFYLRGIERFDVDRTQLLETAGHEQDVFRERYGRLSFPAG